MEVKQKVRFSLGQHESSDKVRVSLLLFLIMANKREFGVVTLYCLPVTVGTCVKTAA